MLPFTIPNGELFGEKKTSRNKPFIGSERETRIM